MRLIPDETDAKLRKTQTNNTATATGSIVLQQQLIFNKPPKLIP